MEGSLDQQMEKEEQSILADSVRKTASLSSIYLSYSTLFVTALLAD